MIARELTQQLLLNNSQFATDEIRFNHEALAIYFKHRFKSTAHSQVFVLAGSEDLRALLPKISLHHSQDEVFILIRPYIHSMAIYAVVVDQKKYFIIFDSQAWSTRYYPTRLLISAINQQIASAEIVLTTETFQFQSYQRGCTEYSIHFLEYCKKHGRDMIAQCVAGNLQALEGYPHTFLLAKEVLPEELKKITMTNNKEWANLQFTENLTHLEQAILKHYVQDKELNYQAIHHTVLEMQGDALPECMASWQQNMYDITVDYHRNKVVLNYNKDFIYSNFLIFSAAIYPSLVSHVKNKLILQNHSQVKVTHDTTNKKIVYAAKDLQIILNAFIELPEKKQVLWTEQMRQQLALAQFSKEVQCQIEMEKIRQDNKGGFEQHQIQLALQYFFKAHEEVYVPAISVLTTQVLFSLSLLKKNGYQFMAFSLAVDQIHQVGIWITLGEEKHNIKIYDSLNDTNLNKIKKNLNQFFANDHDHYEIILVPSFYQAQQDDWSCGIHVIANLMAAHNQIYTSSLNREIQEKLPVQKLIKDYFFAYKIAEQEMQQLEIQLEKNDREKRILLDCLELKRQQLGFYQDNQQKPQDVCKSLADFLQIELWGNLDRKVAGGDQINRKNESEDHKRTQMLPSSLQEYRETAPADIIGQLILQKAIFIFERELSEPHLKLKNFVNLICNYATFHKSQELHDVIQFLDTEIQLEIKIQSNPLTYLIEILQILLNDDDAYHIIKNLFIKMNCPQYIDAELIEDILNMFNHVFVLRLAEVVAKQVCEFKIYATNEYVRLNREEMARSEAISLRKQEIKALLTQIKLIGYLDLELGLLHHQGVFLFLHKYVPCGFFTGCNVHVKRKFILESFENNLTNYDIFTAIKLYPGKKILEFIYAFHNKKTLSPKEITGILKKLPEKLQLAFAIMCQQEIINNEKYGAKILTLLGKKQERFVKHCLQDKKRNFARLLKIINMVEPYRRLNIILCYLPIVNNFMDLHFILEPLPLGERLLLIKEKLACIIYFDELLAILNLLPNSDRFALAKSKQMLITDFVSFQKVLSILSHDHKLEFIMEKGKWIDSFARLCEVLRALTEINRRIIIKDYFKLCISYSELYILIKEYHLQDLEIIKQFKDLIQSITQLKYILIVLDKDKRHQVFCLKEELIKNPAEVYYLIKAFSLEEQKILIRKYQLINSAPELVAFFRKQEETIVTWIHRLGKKYLQSILSNEAGYHLLLQNINLNEKSFTALLKVLGNHHIKKILAPYRKFADFWVQVFDKIPLSCRLVFVLQGFSHAFLLRNLKKVEQLAELLQALPKNLAVYDALFNFIGKAALKKIIPHSYALEALPAACYSTLFKVIGYHHIANIIHSRKCFATCMTHIEAMQCGFFITKILGLHKLRGFIKTEADFAELLELTPINMHDYLKQVVPLYAIKSFIPVQANKKSSLKPFTTLYGELHDYFKLDDKRIIGVATNIFMRRTLVVYNHEQGFVEIIFDRVHFLRQISDRQFIAYKSVQNSLLKLEWQDRRLTQIDMCYLDCSQEKRGTTSDIVVLSKEKCLILNTIPLSKAWTIEILNLQSFVISLTLRVDSWQYNPINQLILLADQNTLLGWWQGETKENHRICLIDSSTMAMQTITLPLQMAAQLLQVELKDTDKIILHFEENKVIKEFALTLQAHNVQSLTKSIEFHTYFGKNYTTLFASPNKNLPTILLEEPKDVSMAVKL